MRDGGCGAIAACESCIYFARTNGIKNLYPHQSQEISWKEYHDFAYVMKHYLCPRPNGIDTLELFMFQHQIRDQTGIVNLSAYSFNSFLICMCSMKSFHLQSVIMRICKIFTKPFHKNEKGPLEDYIWHWFILAGYEKKEDDLLVKAISYGEHKWFSLKEMWDTGYDKKGGMILYHI